MAQGLALVALLTVLGWVSEANAYSSITSREKGVTVDVRPVQLTPGQSAKFQVRLNTHSGNLGQDLAAISTLRDDQGRNYQPANWQGSPPGGHHRRGVLEFPALEGGLRSVTLVISDIAGVPKRIFEWNIEK
jgi:hypothetical protein